MSSTLAMQDEPGSKRALRELFSLIPFEMRITGRRRDLGMYLMERLYPPLEPLPHRVFSRRW